jgi:hypothetical protein
VILVMGNPEDPVVARVTAGLARVEAPFVIVDERMGSTYEIVVSADERAARWRIRGGECVGQRAVGAIFVRHEDEARDRDAAEALRTLRLRLDRLLLSTRCTVINRPTSATANYSKPYQLGQMAVAGFRVPRTLTTNVRASALGFINDLGGRVVFKGVSNLKTVPQVLRPEHLGQLSRLETCPSQFQEFIGGDDFRVTVVGSTSIVTRIVGGEPDLGPCRADALLPLDLINRCIRFTATQGLVMSGIDVRLTPDGTAYAFELNPYPLFTYYETEELPRITNCVVECLIDHQHMTSDVSV